MKYWGGTGFDGAPTKAIRPLEVADFNKLVSVYINVPVAIPCTRREFMAKPKKERDAMKCGPYIIACSMREGTTERRNENASELVLAILDIDGGDEARNMAEHPDTLSDLLYPYNFAAYHTASSTPEDPRIRIMVDLAPCGTEHHKRVVDYVATRIGLPKSFLGRSESGTLSQPMYRPNNFQGEDKSPVLCSRVNGIPLTLAEVPEVIEESDDLDGTTFGYVGEAGADFGLAYLPVQGISVEDILPALDAIDPDCGYYPWFQVGMALRHQFREEESAREAYDAYVDWSSRGSKHREGEPLRKWKSYRPEATGRPPVTIRTLFHFAKQAGWKSGPLEEKVKESVADWIKSCAVVTTLMTEGPKRIMAMPIHNAMFEEMLVTLLCDTLKGLGTKVTKAAIMKQLGSEKLHKRAKDRTSESPNWLRPFIFVSSDNVFRNQINGTCMSPEGFDNTFGKELISDDPESESALQGRPMMRPRDFALNQVKIERVEGTIYCPVKPNEKIVTVDNKILLNTYNPDSVPTEDPANAALAGKLFEEHVAVIVGEPQYREIFIDYVAHNTQHPGEKIPWAFVFQSAEGVGKGFLGRILAGVFGQANVKVIGPQILVSQWDDWKIGSVFTILEEIHIPGVQRETVMNGVKIAIADLILPINKRNTTAFNHPNYTNYIGFTNFLDALHLKPTDRRWCPVESPIQSDEQVARLNASGHFERMEPLLGDLRGGLRHWLMQRKISPSFPRYGPAPKTKYRSAIIDNSKNPVFLCFFVSWVKRSSAGAASFSARVV